MNMVAVKMSFFIFLLVSNVLLIFGDESDLLSQDPSLWPGHMEPFGSKQKTVQVEQVKDWPDPTSFFKEYVDGNKPVLFKGLAKRSPAYELFTDDYLKSFDGAGSEVVYAEPEKKENRTKKGFDMSFKAFVERYHKETLYMVNALPSALRKDVRMPPPLRCEETRELMSSQVTWFSSGGTKSVLHNDDVDNINCLFRGSKELLFIEYNKNKNYVPIDNPQGGYSSIDVDKVDYTKFPLLRHVDQYVHATMDEGDCLFIPYHWFHQVNSKANEQGQNLAINVWFKHVHGHRPKNCDIPVEEATLDKYEFPDDEQQDEEQPSRVERFEEYLTKTKKSSASFKTFMKLIKKDRNINPEKYQIDGFPEDFESHSRNIFDILDVTKDGNLNEDDFDELRKKDQSKTQEVEQALEKAAAKLEDYFEDLVENTYQEDNSIGKESSQGRDEKIEL